MLNIIHTTDIMPPNGHYSQAIEANGFIFTSVQLGILSNFSGTISVKIQLINALNNIDKILLSAESSLNKVVKITVYIKDISNWEIVDQTISSIFETHKPARGVIAVSNLHLNADIAIDVIALK